MKRHEIERALSDPDVLKQWVRRAKSLNKSSRNRHANAGKPVTRAARANADEASLTFDGLQRSARNLSVRSASNVVVTRFLTEKRGIDALVNLRIARMACVDAAEAADLFLLEMAINQLTSEGPLDDTAERALEDSIKVLVSIDERRNSPEDDQ